MNPTFPQITQGSGLTISRVRCCGPISGHTGDVRLSSVHSWSADSTGQYIYAGAMNSGFVPMAQNDGFKTQAAFNTEYGAVHIT